MGHLISLKDFLDFVIISYECTKLQLFIIETRHKINYELRTEAKLSSAKPITNVEHRASN